MLDSIAHRLIKGISANAYGQTINVCAHLFGVPILLYFWGGRLYGEWLILSAVPVYLSMTDLGLAQSAGNDMTQLVARGNYEEALAVFQSVGILIALCSLGVLILVATLLTATTLPSLLPIQMLSATDAIRVLGLLAGEIILSINTGTLHAGYRASGGYALHTVMNNSTKLIQYTVLWILAASGGGPVAGAAAFFFVRLFATPIVAVLLVRRYAWVKIGISHARLSDLHRLFGPAVANLAFPFAQSLNIQGMRLVVGATLGPIAVVSFTTLRTLSRLILQLTTAFSHASEPEMAAAYGNGNTMLLRKLYSYTTRFTGVLAFGLAGILYWTGEWILAFWTHGKVSMDAPLFSWLMASTVICTLWYSSLIVLKAANRHLHAAIFFVTVSALAVTLAYGILSASGRLSNVGIALLLMDISMAVYAVPAAWRLSGNNLKRFD
jgi:O-antigen/teichoic acid export membrane protein